ncbi:hypothetical protein H7097_03825 [Aeromicrobium sp.]|nr:hypothetical protein [Candidatus Saccharibacteria bacterium]
MASAKITKTKKITKPSRRVRAAQKSVPSKRLTSKKLPAPPNKIPLIGSDAPERSRWCRTPKSERPVRPKLPSVLRLTRSSNYLLSRNWKLIIGIAIIYGVLNILLVRGLSGGTNATELKSQFSELYKGGWGNLASGLSVFAVLLSSSNSGKAADTTGAYQSFLLVTTSLALIWAFRQLMAENTDSVKLRIRDAFYKGMYPLVPAILILLVIGVQLIPMLLGGLVFSIVITNGIAITGLEVGLWLALFAISIVTSLLLITPSIFALYISSLPDMTPVRALRSARALVRFRRVAVLRKLLFLPLLIFSLLAAIVLPIIFIVPVLAQWVFLVLSIFILPAVHAYLYTFYRELLHD